MSYYKPFNFLKELPLKLNNYYKKIAQSCFKVSNKSKTIKDFDPVTNIDVRHKPEIITTRFGQEDGQIRSANVDRRPIGCSSQAIQIVTDRWQGIFIAQALLVAIPQIRS